MSNLMRALKVILFLQVAVLCYSLYIISNMEMSTLDYASLVDAQGEE